MYLDQDFPPGGDRPAMLLRVVAAFERDEIETAVDRLIAMLDARDGDADMEDDDRAATVMGVIARDRDYADQPLAPPDGLAGDPEDAEPIGDDLDGNGAEDDFMDHDHDGPGCPIADPDHGAEESSSGGGGDPSWTEWHTRGRHKVDGYGAEIVGRDRRGNMLHEDTEDDDADTGVEDGGFDADEDKGIDDEPHDGEGLDEPDDRTSRLARRPHRDRIRTTRCDRIVCPVDRRTGRHHVEYQLRQCGGARVTMGSAL